MLRPSTVAVRPTWLKRKERAGSQVRRVPAVRRRRVGEGAMMGGRGRWGGEEEGGGIGWVDGGGGRGGKGGKGGSGEEVDGGGEGEEQGCGSG